jgi:hypothetical protein
MVSGTPSGISRSKKAASFAGPVHQELHMIRVDKIWLATEPMDMRAGPDTELALANLILNLVEW